MARAALLCSTPLNSVAAAWIKTEERKNQKKQWVTILGHPEWANACWDCHCELPSGPDYCRRCQLSRNWPALFPKESAAKLTDAQLDSIEEAFAKTGF